MANTAPKTAERIAEQKLRAIEYYREIPILKHAAAFAGVHEDTIHIWKKEDAQFSDDLQKAKSEFIRKHGKRAKSEFLLERLDKEHFKETKELEVRIPKPILGGLSKEDEDQGTDSSVQ